MGSKATAGPHAVMLTTEHLAMVRFCAVECELQMSGERSVSWMMDAWAYAQRMERPTVTDVLVLGQLVEPEKNALGFRQCGVRVGTDIKGDWTDVPRQITELVVDAYGMAPSEWFRQYEEIHPFVDGNGRTGAILYNLLNETLHAPVWPPNYWRDPRRKPGDGAP